MSQALATISAEVCGFLPITVGSRRFPATNMRHGAANCEKRISEFVDTPKGSRSAPGAVFPRFAPQKIEPAVGRKLKPVPLSFKALEQTAEPDADFGDVLPNGASQTA